MLQNNKADVKIYSICTRLTHFTTPAVSGLLLAAYSGVESNSRLLAMSWEKIIGHEHALDRFRRSLQRHRLANTYLFVGPDGIGKRTFALKLAQSLLCESDASADSDLEPCGSCPGCIQVEKQNHPDLLLVSKPEDKSILPVDLFIGRKEHRRKEGLVHEIGMKPFRGGYRIAIIDDADYFNQESANSLLKTLEEPPPSSVIILIGTSEQRQLQTIVSRSQVIRFERLDLEQLVEVLSRTDAIDKENLPDGVSMEALARCANGSVARACQLADPDVFQFRQTLLQKLATSDPHAGQFTKTITDFAESGGKEGWRKRPRLTLVADLAIEFYRELALRLAGGQSSCQDELLVNQANRLAEPLLQDPLENATRVADCIARTADMQYHVAANVGFPNLIDSWLIDVGRILRGEPVTTGEILSGMF